MDKYRKNDRYPDFEFVQQVVAQIPWGHNVVLMDKISDDTVRKWYIEQSIEHGWSRNVLVHRLLIKDSIDDAMMEVLKQKQTVFDNFADESVTGVADIEINEKALGELVEQEKKNRGIA